MSVSDMIELSVNVKLFATFGNTIDYIEFPLVEVEGMGLGSSIYHGALVPKIKGGFGGNSDFFFFLEETQTPSSNLNQLNGEPWLVLVTIPSKTQSDFKLRDDYLSGSQAIDGLIVQYAVAPDQPGPTEAGKALDKICNEIALPESTLSNEIPLFGFADKQLMAEVRAFTLS